MLEFMITPPPPSFLYSDSHMRCSVCGQGPLMAGNGHLMSHCLNCGRFQHSTILFTWQWLDLPKKLWSRLKHLLAPFSDGLKRLFSNAPIHARDNL